MHKNILLNLRLMLNDFHMLNKDTYQFERMTQILCHKIPPVASRAVQQLSLWSQRGGVDPLRPRGKDGDALSHRGSAERAISVKRGFGEETREMVIPCI